MSNAARRRRHFHRPHEARRVAARQRFADGELPFIPGTVADLSEQSLEQAMTEAHEVLPYLPGTQVVVRSFTVVDGIRAVSDLMGADAAVQLMLKVQQRGHHGIVICSREPHECEGEECPHD